MRRKVLCRMMFATMLMLSGGIFSSNEDNVLAKTDLKTQVQIDVSGQKVGNRTYYLNKKKLMSMKSGHKAKAIAKNVLDFKVSNGVVYYVGDGRKLYRMKTDGTKKKKLASGCLNIHDIRGKYICYSGETGCFTINKNGKKKSKIFQYLTVPVYLNGRYYATKTIEQADGQGKDCVLQSVKTNGTGKKTEYKFENAYTSKAMKVQGEIAVATYYNNKEASIWQKNNANKYEETKLGGGAYIIGNIEYTMDKWIVYAEELNDENKNSELSYDPDVKKARLYEVKKDGSFELYIDLASMPIYYHAGAYNGLKKEGKYITITVENGKAVYILDKTRKKVIRTLSTVASENSDFKYKIKKNVVSYQRYDDSYGEVKEKYTYRKYKL